MISNIVHILNLLQLHYLFTFYVAYMSDEFISTRKEEWNNPVYFSLYYFVISLCKKRNRRWILHLTLSLSLLSVLCVFIYTTIIFSMIFQYTSIIKVFTIHLHYASNNPILSVMFALTSNHDSHFISWCNPLVKSFILLY